MVKTIFAHDTAAPTMPSTSDPANFPTRADAALSYLTSGTELEIQDTATDTTAGRIPKMGNDAAFDDLSLSGILTLTGAASSAIKRNDTTGVQYLFGGTGAADGANVALYGSTQATSPNLMVLEGDKIRFRAVDNTEYARIDSSGNVGVGNSSPFAKLDTITPEASAPVARLRASSASYTSTAIQALVDTSAAGTFNFLTATSAGSDVEFKLSGNGNGTCDGAWTGGGADYAEYFEWADGNPEGADRRGLSVVLDGAKIRPAVTGEIPFGVISGNPSVIGDGDIDRWKEKYLRDDFGACLLEDYEVIEWTETVTETKTEQVQATEEVERTVIEVENGVAIRRVKLVTVPVFDEIPMVDEAGTDLGTHRVPRMVDVTRETTKEVQHSYAADAVPVGVTVPVYATRTTQQRRVLNPAYDPNLPYVSRAERPEWDVVGLMGKLRLRKGQPVAPSWIKMRDVSADIEEWLVR